MTHETNNSAKHERRTMCAAHKMYNFIFGVCECEENDAYQTVYLLPATEYLQYELSFFECNKYTNE